MDFAQTAARNYYGSVELNNSNAVLGDQYVTILPQHETEIEKQSKLFLASIKDPDMNARRNDIHETKFDTFEWMMRDDARLGDRIPSITRWLSHGTGKYFIQGKAGSGKSTLMKFIFEHERTKYSLRRWSPKCSPMFHAFWIAGSKGQKTLRGMIASLVFQIIHQDRERVLELSYDVDSKSCLNDWSTKELTTVLTTLLGKQSHAYCLFIDGLDEHDDFDNDVLLDLIDTFCALPNVKACLSTRPVLHINEWAIGCPVLVLHELTAEDIKAYVTGVLDAKLKSKSADEEYLSAVDLLAQEICQKAEGVFVWVYYVMHNVLRGLRIGDDVDALRKRIADLPSEISTLYRKMWDRQNSDNKVHASEAQKMFSYVSKEGEIFFLFAMLLDAGVRSRYLSNFQPFEEICLDNFCQRIKRKVIIRCAGLLECLSSTNVGNDSLKGRKSGDTAQQAWWRNCTVKYFHRTAYDFVIGSGLAVSNSALSVDSAICVQYVEASIPCFIEEVFDFSHYMLRKQCFRHILRLEAQDLPSVEACIGIINRMVQEILKDRGPPRISSFWAGDRLVNTTFSPSDLTSALLHTSFYPDWVDGGPKWPYRPPSWLLDYLASRASRWTRFHRGWAIFCVTTFLDGYKTTSEIYNHSHTARTSIRIFNLLLQYGADLCTPQCLRFKRGILINTPASSLLSLLAEFVTTPSLALDVADLKLLRGYLESSTLPSKCGVWLSQRQYSGLSSLFPRDWLPWSRVHSGRSGEIWNQIAVLMVFASNELLTLILESIESGVDEEHNEFLVPNSIDFRSKLVSLLQSVKVAREDLYSYDLDDIDGDNPDLALRQSAVVRRIVQKALLLNYQEEANFESDILDAVDVFDDVQADRLKRLIEPTCGLDLSVPVNTALSYVDSYVEINTENWKEKGPLREYYASLKIGWKDIDSTNQTQTSVTSELPDPSSDVCTNTTRSAAPAAKKRKRPESMNVETPTTSLRQGHDRLSRNA